MTAQIRADVAILGAGAAGGALAVRLAAMGARVVLVDARPDDAALWPDKPGERLPAASRFALDDLGVGWEDFTLPEAGLRLHWSGAQPQAMAAAAPALLCRRNALDAGLMVRAQALGARVLTGHRLAGLEGQPGRWALHLHGPNVQGVAAALMVDASGRRAVLAQALGQGLIRRDDAMIGLLRWWQGGATVPPAVFHLQALTDGWCYASALPGGRGVTGFITLRGLMQGRPLQAWQGAWQRAPLIRSAVPAGAVWGPVASFAAGPGRAAQVVGPGWARIGDAAAQGDPVEGQGVLRALQTAHHLAGLIGAEASAQAAARQQYQHFLTDWHAGHLAQRRLIYNDSDQLGAAFLAGIATGPRAAWG